MSNHHEGLQAEHALKSSSSLAFFGFYLNGGGAHHVLHDKCRCYTQTCTRAHHQTPCLQQAVLIMKEVLHGSLGDRINIHRWLRDMAEREALRTRSCSIQPLQRIHSALAGLRLDALCRQLGQLHFTLMLLLMRFGCSSLLLSSFLFFLGALCSLGKLQLDLLNLLFLCVVSALGLEEMSYLPAHQSQP